MAGFAVWPGRELAFRLVNRSDYDDLVGLAGDLDDPVLLRLTDRADQVSLVGASTAA